MTPSLKLLLAAVMVLVHCVLIAAQGPTSRWGPGDMTGFADEMMDIEAAIVAKCNQPVWQQEGPDLQSLPLMLGTPNFDAALSIELENMFTQESPTAGVARLTNTGKVPLDILQPGLLLSGPNWLGQITVKHEEDNETAPWTQLDPYTNEFYTADDWLHLEPGVDNPVMFDAAKLFNLSTGGDFSFHLDTTMIAKYLGKYLISLPITSNTMYMKDVDGVRAAHALGAAAAGGGEYLGMGPETGTGISQIPDCGYLKTAKLNGAINWAARMCLDGAWAALGHNEFEVYNDKFAHFFHAYEKEARCYVAGRYLDFARELRIHGRYATSFVRCDDLYAFCATGHFYTYRHRDAPLIIHTCNGLWQLRHYERECFVDSFATAILHEVTQFPLPATRPCEQIANGMPECTILTWNEAKRNADTYVWFAQSAHLHCPDI